MPSPTVCCFIAHSNRPKSQKSSRRVGSRLAPPTLPYVAAAPQVREAVVPMCAHRAAVGMRHHSAACLIATQLRHRFGPQAKRAPVRCCEQRRHPPFHAGSVGFCFSFTITGGKVACCCPHKESLRSLFWGNRKLPDQRRDGCADLSAFCAYRRTDCGVSSMVDSVNAGSAKQANRLIHRVIIGEVERAENVDMQQLPGSAPSVVDARAARSVVILQLPTLHIEQSVIIDASFFCANCSDQSASTASQRDSA